MEIVGAFACSHAGLIVDRRDAAPPAQREAVYTAFAAARDEIAALRPDVLVILATDHMKAYPLPSVPQFSIGVGPQATGLGDAGIAPCKVPVHQPLAQAVLEGCVARHVDMAFSEEVRIDHSFAMPLSLLTPDADVPIVPIAQNCNVPPRPPFARSREVGTAVRAALAEGPEGRCVVVGTGGLSHWVGSQERRDFMRRPAGTRWADLADHPVTLTDTGEINRDFDERFLDAVRAGRTAELVSAWTPDALDAEAGNGAQELRTWLTTAAVLGDPPATVLAYEPVAEWLTGVAVVRFDVA